ncbi:MAG: dehydrogenase E1 component subunit alpha/beta [Holophagales bacterium]|nr:dehydrogenase E1 component subunit alpha/beta [Holophagales bacterium]
MRDATAARLLHYAYMKLSRDFDLRYAMLLKTGRLSKWYSQIGGEATTVAAGLALEPGDVLCSLHRDLGAILTTYLDPVRAFPDFGFEEAVEKNAGSEGEDLRPKPEELMYRLACQLLGRADGFSNGVERSFHYGYVDPVLGIRHIGMISHLGAMIPVAAGAAFALAQDGTDRVALNFIGDGGTSTGDFHEGLNMAAVWKLPLVLVVENNRYAFATPTRDQFACERLSDRAVGYGIAGETVDGNDPLAVSEAVARAVKRARDGRGPTLIEALLGRMRGHSEGDDSLKVVPSDELERYMEEDPVPAYARRLEAEGLLDSELQARLEARISQLVESSLQRALDCPEPDDAVALRPALAPVVADAASRAADSALDELAPSRPGGEGETFVEGIHRALLEEMDRDDRVVLLGQDIAAFEGAFRITKGMHRRWPSRVRDTPIAESGTLGIAAGAALLGYRPVVEMQFGDFITCGFNQTVNMIAKVFYRWQIPCPLVIRLPVGGGVGAGPYHSQNPEAWFAHVAGLEVVCPATAADAKALLKASIRSPNPVIFCEHKYLYRRIKGGLPEGDVVPVLGKAKIRRPGTDLTFVTYGAQVWTCLEAAEELAKDGIEVEVLDLRTLVPLDEEAMLESVKKTHRAVVVHEAQLTGGFGGELAARLASAAFSWLDAPIERVAYEDRAVPFAKNLEQVLLPTLEKVLATARRVVEF